MIGDVPKGAPLRCKAGRHVGQDRGGLMAFQCSRCGGTYWQTDPKYRAAMAAVTAIENRNLPAEDEHRLCAAIYEETTGHELTRGSSKREEGES